MVLKGIEVDISPGPYQIHLPTASQEEGGCPCYAVIVGQKYKPCEPDFSGGKVIGRD